MLNSILDFRIFPTGIITYLIDGMLKSTMVEFRERQGKIEAFDTEASLADSMKLQFINEESAVFINTSTGKAEDVDVRDIPDEYLKQELQFQRDRANNTQSEEIESKVRDIEKILNQKS